MAGSIWVCLFVTLVALTASVCASGGVRVHGRVFCQDCQRALSGNGTLATHRTPLQGAFVALRCYNQTSQAPLSLVGRTSALGTFSIELKGDDAALLLQHCKATLLASPSSRCSVKTDLNYGISGSIPIFDAVSSGTVGPFAFTPYYCQ